MRWPVGSTHVGQQLPAPASLRLRLRPRPRWPTDLLAGLPDRHVVLVRDDAHLVHQPDLLLVVALERIAARVDVGEEAQDGLGRDGLRARRRRGGGQWSTTWCLDRRVVGQLGFIARPSWSSLEREGGGEGDLGGGEPGAMYWASSWCDLSWLGAVTAARNAASDPLNRFCRRGKRAAAQSAVPSPELSKPPFPNNFMAAARGAGLQLLAVHYRRQKPSVSAWKPSSPLRAYLPIYTPVYRPCCSTPGRYYATYGPIEVRLAGRPAGNALISATTSMCSDTHARGTPAPACCVC